MLTLHHHIITLYDIYKRQRIPKGQSKMDNQEKLATWCTQDTYEIMLAGSMFMSFWIFILWIVSLLVNLY